MSGGALIGRFSGQTQAPPPRGNSNPPPQGQGQARPANTPPHQSTSRKSRSSPNQNTGGKKGGKSTSTQSQPTGGKKSPAPVPTNKNSSPAPVPAQPVPAQPVPAQPKSKDLKQYIDNLINTRQVTEYEFDQENRNFLISNLQNLINLHENKENLRDALVELNQQCILPTISEGKRVLPSQYQDQDVNEFIQRLLQILGSDFNEIFEIIEVDFSFCFDPSSNNKILTDTIIGNRVYQKYTLEFSSNENDVDIEDSINSIQRITEDDDADGSCQPLKRYRKKVFKHGDKCKYLFVYITRDQNYGFVNIDNILFDNITYTPIGIINYIESRGHFISYTNVGQKWYKFDDSPSVSIKEVDPFVEDFNTEGKPLMILYEKFDPAVSFKAKSLKYPLKLDNIGTTCFINTGLQLLFNTEFYDIVKNYVIQPPTPPPPQKVTDVWDQFNQKLIEFINNSLQNLPNPPVVNGDIEKQLVEQLYYVAIQQNTDRDIIKILFDIYDLMLDPNEPQDPIPINYIENIFANMSYNFSSSFNFPLSYILTCIRSEPNFRTNEGLNTFTRTNHLDIDNALNKTSFQDLVTTYLSSSSSVDPILCKTSPENVLFSYNFADFSKSAYILFATINIGNIDIEEKININYPGEIKEYELMGVITEDGGEFSSMVKLNGDSQVFIPISAKLNNNWFEGNSQVFIPISAKIKQLLDSGKILNALLYKRVDYNPKQIAEPINFPVSMNSVMKTALNLLFATDFLINIEEAFKQILPPPPAQTQAPPAQTQAPPAQTQAPPAQTQAPPAQTQAPPAQTQAPPLPPPPAQTKLLFPTTSQLQFDYSESTYLTDEVLCELKKSCAIAKTSRILDLDVGSDYLQLFTKKLGNNGDLTLIQSSFSDRFDIIYEKVGSAEDAIHCNFVGHNFINYFSNELPTFLRVLGSRTNCYGNNNIFCFTKGRDPYVLYQYIEDCVSLRSVIDFIDVQTFFQIFSIIYASLIRARSVYAFIHNNLTIDNVCVLFSNKNISIPSIGVTNSTTIPFIKGYEKSSFMSDKFYQRIEGGGVVKDVITFLSSVYQNSNSEAIKSMCIELINIFSPSDFERTGGVDAEIQAALARLQEAQTKLKELETGVFEPLYEERVTLAEAKELIELSKKDEEIQNKIGTLTSEFNRVSPAAAVGSQQQRSQYEENKVRISGEIGKLEEEKRNIMRKIEELKSKQASGNPLNEAVYKIAGFIISKDEQRKIFEQYKNNLSNLYNSRIDKRIDKYISKYIRLIFTNYYLYFANITSPNVDTKIKSGLYKELNDTFASDEELPGIFDDIRYSVLNKDYTTGIFTAIRSKAVNSIVNLYDKVDGYKNQLNYNIILDAYNIIFNEMDSILNNLEIIYQKLEPNVEEKNFNEINLEILNRIIEIIISFDDRNISNNMIYITGFLNYYNEINKTINNIIILENNIIVVNNSIASQADISIIERENLINTIKMTNQELESLQERKLQIMQRGDTTIRGDQPISDCYLIESNTLFRNYTNNIELMSLIEFNSIRCLILKDSESTKRLFSVEDPTVIWKLAIYPFYLIGKYNTGDFCIIDPANISAFGNSPQWKEWENATKDIYDSFKPFVDEDKIMSFIFALMNFIYPTFAPDGENTLEPIINYDEVNPVVGNNMQTLGDWIVFHITFVPSKVDEKIAFDNFLEIYGNRFEIIKVNLIDAKRVVETDDFEKVRYDIIYFYSIYMALEYINTYLNNIDETYFNKTKWKNYDTFVTQYTKNIITPFKEFGKAVNAKLKNNQMVPLQGGSPPIQFQQYVAEFLSPTIVNNIIRITSKY